MEDLSYHIGSSRTQPVIYYNACHTYNIPLLVFYRLFARCHLETANSIGDIFNSSANCSVQVGFPPDIKSNIADLRDSDDRIWQEGDLIEDGCFEQFVLRREIINISAERALQFGIP